LPLVVPIMTCVIFFGFIHRSLLQNQLVLSSPPCHRWRVVPPLMSRCVPLYCPSCLSSGRFVQLMLPVLLLLLRCLFLFACLTFACLM
jgi:hypothetical protein